MPGMALKNLQKCFSKLRILFSYHNAAAVAGIILGIIDFLSDALYLVISFDERRTRNDERYFGLKFTSSRRGLRCPMLRGPPAS